MAVVNRRHAGGLSEFKLQLASRSSAPRLRPPRLKAQLRTRSGFAEVKWRGGWSEIGMAVVNRRHAGGLSEFKLQLASGSSAPRFARLA